MTPTVYVVQDSKGKNILPAKKYGRLQVLLTPSDLNKGSTFIASKISRQLSSIQPYDYLLLIGDPVAIGIATHLALHFTHGLVNVLKWDRHTYEYNTERMEIVI
mgnify:CR=1 FL=1